MFAKVKRLNYRHLVPDTLVILFSFYLSLLLRVGPEGFSQYLQVLNRHIPLFLMLRLGIFTALGVYDIIWRYISLGDAAKLAKAVLLSTLITISTTYLVDIGRIPRAVFFIDAFLGLLLLGGVRFSRRFLYEKKGESQMSNPGEATIIIGAGVTGRALASRLQVENDSGYLVVGFVDDDAQKVGRFIGGHRVLGTVAELDRILKDTAVKQVIIGIAHPSGALLRKIVKQCRAHGVATRLARSIASHFGQSGTLQGLRGIELADLLNRPRKQIELLGIKQLIEGRTVLVTGAGGTIGSELARQIARMDPARLLLLDHAEYNLYEIDRELRVGANANEKIIPLLIDLKSKSSLRRVFLDYVPEVVIHAAAYKHVHLVEVNPLAAILNNIGGTKNLIDLSLKRGVETFLLISTDKAVNPVGIMGATKRLCELMISSAGKKGGRRYCSVRFGNVLGSSGSLIPLLTEQITKGEPITITHPEMTRYFMLVEEAVSLVLKAVTVAKPGDILLLDMGAPVKIVDMAKSLFALVGTGDNEPAILYTGLRPGEKLFEELYLSGNETPTQFSDILVVPRDGILAPQGADQLDEQVNAIFDLAETGDSAAVVLLREVVKKHSLSAETLKATAFCPERVETASPQRPEVFH